MTARRTDTPPVEPHWVGEDWPGYLGAPLERPRTPDVIVVALAVGIAFDLAMRAGLVGVAGAAAIALASIALIATRRLRHPHAYALVAAAPLFGMWLALRMSDWLLPLDIIAACGLVLLGTSLSSGGSLWDLSFTKLLARGMQAAAQPLLAPAFLLRGWTRRTGGFVRGALIAGPIVLVLVALLASADAVFASFIDVDLSDVIAHTALIVFGTLAMASLIRLASLKHVDEPRIPSARLGTTEWVVVLVALNVVLGAFAIARVISLTEGGRRVIEEAGLTYAEYARSGFFQLVGAALLTTAALLALRAVADVASHRPLFVTLSLGVVALTLAMVVSAFHRLVLYESVFGLTMLRILVQTAIVWIGIVLLMVGARMAGVGEGRSWLGAAAGITALVLLFALNVMNPEAFVARHNIAHEERQARFDAPYLAELGEDAVPELAKHRTFDAQICASVTDTRDGWAAYNLARERAREIGSRLCRPGG